jgi:hypothetical protein
MADTAKDDAREPLPQRRQSTRDTISHHSQVVRPGNLAIDVHLVDLSPNGFHARCSERPFQRGESVAVRLPLIGQVQARVMWGLRGCFGCQFLVPIDARTYLDVLAMIRKAERAD